MKQRPYRDWIYWLWTHLRTATAYCIPELDIKYNTVKLYDTWCILSSQLTAIKLILIWLSSHTIITPHIGRQIAERKLLEFSTSRTKHNNWKFEIPELHQTILKQIVSSFSHWNCRQWTMENLQLKPGIRKWSKLTSAWKSTYIYHMARKISKIKNRCNKQ